MAGSGSVVARRSTLFRGVGRRRAGAVLSAGILLALSAPLSPASAAVTCDDTWTPGTLDASGNWTAGAGSDYRIVCTADTDGDTVTAADGPDDIPANARKLVTHVSGPNVDRIVEIIPDAEGGQLALTGSLGSSVTNRSAVFIRIDRFTAGYEGNNAVVESFLTIDSTADGADGIEFRNEDANHTGRIEAINRGEITTTGDGFAYGLGVRSAASSARAVNAGTIATSGDGGRGVFARVAGGRAGTASVINRGTVRTSGGVSSFSPTPDNTFFGPSDGVRAVHDANGDAEASNEAAGIVTVSGVGGRGVSASASGTGNADAENAGSVVTRGDAFVYPSNTSWIGPYGVLAFSRGGGDVTARNLTSGSVDTHGVPGYGVVAITRGGGTASVENAGTVNTHATRSNSTLPNNVGLEIGARGLYATSWRGDATVVNDVSGSVETRGARAFGALASISNDGSARSATATIRNRGRVATSGDNADAVIALSTRPATAAHPNTVRAYNEDGGTITTQGDAASGLGASILVARGGQGYGSAFAQNDGTITTGGGRGGVTGTDIAFGITASFFNNDGGLITGAGDVEARNTGTITVSGEGAQGIQARTFGSGRATVVVDGGRVIATHDSATDADDGVGIFATSGAPRNAIAVTLDNRALVQAPQAMLLGDAPATVNVMNNSVVRGRMSFGDANDRLTIRDSVTVGDISTGDGDDYIGAAGGVTMTGDIDFGAGEDTLFLDVSRPSHFTGNITNLERLNKQCPGDFTIHGDVNFTRSSVVVSEGGLVLTGHMNVGDGTVTVEGDDAELIALLTADDTPKITAGETTVRDGGKVVVQAAENAGTVDAAQAVVTFLEDAEVQGGEALEVQTRDGEGELTMLGSFDPTAGTATVAEGASVGARPAEPGVTPMPGPDPMMPTRPAPTTPGTGTGTGGGGDDNTTALVLGGGAILAALFAVLDWDTEAPASSASLNPALVQPLDRSSRYWVRSLSQSMPESGAGAASGTEIGLDFAIGNGFVLGFAAAPDAALERAGAGAHATALSGGRYVLKAGWRGETLFGGISLSQASWRVASDYRNPTAGGGLHSRYEADQRDAKLGLGARLDLGAGLTLTPRAGAFAGELTHESHSAEGPVFRAAMPEVVQRYGGWRMGLDLASDWQDGPGDLKLRPSLKLGAARVWTDSPEFALGQSDRLGIVSTASRARLPGAPGTVLGLGTGIDATGSHGLSLGLRYGGLVLDGKLVHAAFARAKLSF